MSIRAIQTVWDSSAQKGSALLLLLAIADYADDENCAWPAVSTLAQKIRMSERHVQGLLAHLAVEGEIKIHANRGMRGCNLYQIVKQPLRGEAGCTGGVKPDARRGEAGCAKGVNPASPNPSLNRQEPERVEQLRFDSKASQPLSRSIFFDDEEIQKVFDSWIEHQRSKGIRHSEGSIRAQAETLKAMGNERAREIMLFSILRNAKNLILDASRDEIPRHLRSSAPQKTVVKKTAEVAPEITPEQRHAALQSFREMTSRIGGKAAA